MKSILSTPSRNVPAQSGLNEVMLAERHVCAVIPAVIDAVWSVELSKTLRSALGISRRHQETLRKNFHAYVDERETATSEHTERAILRTLETQPKGSTRDLALIRLVAGLIREKIRGYEHVLDEGQFMKYEHRRMLGGALSDDVSTDLFLQEFAERFAALKPSLRLGTEVVITS